MPPVIAITMGDPGGIGPEIILKALRNSGSRKARILLVGSYSVFKRAARQSGICFNPSLLKEGFVSFPQTGSVFFLDIVKLSKKILGKTNGVRARALTPRVTRRKTSLWNSSLAYASLEVASNLASQGLVQGIVTAPISKAGFRLIDPKFIGHTEYLAQAAQVKDYAMMFVSPKLKVTLATIHCPLKKVASQITLTGVLSKIKLTNEFLKKRLGIKRPHIGVSALNPHGSEFGTEEHQRILPAVQKARKHGIAAIGPLPGDTVFHQAYAGKFDAVVAMYHDQGLAPFKMLAFDQGVNVTLGLPFIRTSPDHGTAFDIAYQNKANSDSFQAALELSEKVIFKKITV